MRCLLIVTALSVSLSACARPVSTPTPPESPAGCARSPTDGETDGGLGGTGNAPEPCEEQRIVE